MRNEGALPLRPGDVVAERYRVERVLGVGGMGAVFAARDRSGELVAVKCLLDELASDPEVLARFAREARATERIRDPHVTRVIDAGALASGVPFIAMEYLEGCDLRRYLRDNGRLSGSAAAKIGIQICRALGEAHALGIVHRDLKLGNIFVVEPQRDLFVKVLDFGVAKFLSSSVSGDQHEMTQTNSQLGSRTYMAPEQMLRPRDVDGRCDIWSLGVNLYYLLAGKPPFDGQTPEELIVQILQAEPAPLTTLRPDISSSLAGVIHRCLTKDRDARYASMAEVERALEPFTAMTLEAADGPTQSRRILPSGPHLAMSETLGRARHKTPQRPFWYAAPFLVVGAAAAVAFVARGRAREPAAARSAISPSIEPVATAALEWEERSAARAKDQLASEPEKSEPQKTDATPAPSEAITSSAASKGASPPLVSPPRPPRLRNPW